MIPKEEYQEFLQSLDQEQTDFFFNYRKELSRLKRELRRAVSEIYLENSLTHRYKHYKEFNLKNEELYNEIWGEE